MLRDILETLTNTWNEHVGRKTEDWRPKIARDNEALGRRDLWEGLGGEGGNRWNKWAVSLTKQEGRIL